MPKLEAIGLRDGEPHKNDDLGERSRNIRRRATESSAKEPPKQSAHHMRCKLSSNYVEICCRKSERQSPYVHATVPSIPPVETPTRWVKLPLPGHFPTTATHMRCTQVKTPATRAVIQKEVGAVVMGSTRLTYQ